VIHQSQIIIYVASNVLWETNKGCMRRWDLERHGESQ